MMTHGNDMTNRELYNALSVLMDEKLEEKLEEKIGGLKEDVSSLKEDVSSLKEDVSSLKEDVSNLKEDVSNLKEEMKEQKAGLSSLQQEMKEQKAGLSKLQKDMHVMRLIHENEILPRLGEIEQVYLSTFKRYLNQSESYESMKMDVSNLKIVVAEHSKILAGIR